VLPGGTSLLPEAAKLLAQYYVCTTVACAFVVLEMLHASVHCPVYSYSKKSGQQHAAICFGSCTAISGNNIK
jgi:hypothetical protein